MAPFAMQFVPQSAQREVPWRSLWLLRGGGLQLRMDGREVTLARRYERIDFAGEMAVQARLLAGATEDLNVMVARDTCRSSSDVLAVPRGTFDRDLGTGQHVVLALGKDSGGKRPEPLAVFH